MVLFVEWLHHRTGDPLYRRWPGAGRGSWSRCSPSAWSPARSSASRWGCCGRTSWPRSAASSGSAFAIEGFSFFLEAIFIAIYVYGWDRLSPRAHMLSGVPIVITGFTGSLMVIAVNALDEPPGGLRAGRTARSSTSSRGRRCSPTRTSGTSWSTCTSPATSSPASCSPAAYAFGRLRGRWGRYERTALGDPADRRGARRAGPGARRRLGRRARSRRTSRPSSPRSRGSAETSAARPMHIGGWYTRRRGQVRDPRSRKLLSLLAFHDPNARGAGARRRARRPTGRR